MKTGRPCQAPTHRKTADIDYYLQLTAGYTDQRVRARPPWGHSAYPPVQGLRSHKAPKFAADQDTARTESSLLQGKYEKYPGSFRRIGDPVVAPDEDGDILTYTLTDHASAGKGVASLRLDVGVGIRKAAGLLGGAVVSDNNR